MWKSLGSSFAVEDFLVANGESGPATVNIGYHKFCALGTIGGESPHGSVLRTSTVPDENQRFPYQAAFNGYGNGMALRVTCIN